MSDQERAETAAPKRRALFFGVQAYLDEALPARPGTSAALRHLAELFELDGWSVRLLIDDAAEEGARPLRANLLAQLRWLAEGEARFAFLSCACAGVYLLPRDARVGLFEQTALDISQVGALLKGAGVLLDMPARPEALDGAAWALGLPIEERAELSAYKQGPTPFLKRALRGLSGQAGAIGAPITNADLARFMITDSSRAHAAAEPDRVAPWFFGSASPILTPRGRGATCGRCGERIEDALATFCPACGQSLFGVERLDGGRYRLLRALGEGGMGKVFLAEDTRLKAERAIKLLSLPSGLPQRERAELRGRLLQEAQAAQQLSGLSQHIVQVYDLGYSSEHGEPFLVMEVLKGETLTSRLAQGPLGLDATVRLGREIASTLAIAHGEGMIHRDLKPDNIMLIQRGGRADFVKLLDFGLVKMEEAEVKTATGHIMGTLQYMPPEQLKGEVVDHRADIFAFSAILYECISGARAIAGRSQREIFAVLLGEGVEPLAARCPQMPKALTHLIDRGLSLDMEARPESVSEFLAVFDALTSPRSSALMTQALDQLSKPKRDLGRLRLALGFLIGLALGGLGGPLLSAPSPSPVAPQALDVGLSAPPPDARPPAPDVAAPTPTPLARPSAPLSLPQPEGVRRRVEAGRLIYEGGEAAGRFSAALIDALLSTARVGEIDPAAEAAWAAAAPPLRAAFAEAFDPQGFQATDEVIEVELSALQAIRAAQRLERRAARLGDFWLRSGGPLIVEAGRCGDLQAGDRVVTISWRIHGYDHGSCAEASCASRTDHALHKARAVGEKISLRLKISRKVNEGEDTPLDTACSL